MSPNASPSNNNFDYLYWFHNLDENKMNKYSSICNIFKNKINKYSSICNKYKNKI